MKIIKAIGLVLGTLGAYVIAGPFICIVIWVTMFGLFMTSRFSQRAIFFSEWSWPQFLVTVGFGLGMPYIWLLLGAGF